MKWSEAKKIISENKDVKKELKNNENEYKLIKTIIKARQEKHLTQTQLANLIGTKQTNISRLESGNYNPTIEFLTKIAKAMDKDIEIKII